MPTQAEFEQAASSFDEAAGHAGDLAAAIAATDTSSALLGGRLAAEAPARVIEAASVASSCVGDLREAAAMCRTRARVIARYLADLERYEARLPAYRKARKDWLEDYSDHLEGGPHPGNPPVAPRHPGQPPAWADV